jgi:hypothetical protein
MTNIIFVLKNNRLKVNRCAEWMEKAIPKNTILSESFFGNHIRNIFFIV